MEKRGRGEGFNDPDDLTELFRGLSASLPTEFDDLSWDDPTEEPARIQGLVSPTVEGAAHAEQATIPDPRINFTVPPNVEMIQCPYEPNHLIQDSRFLRHVNICHQAHLRECRAKGKQSDFAICGINQSHHIPIAMMEKHKETCANKEDDSDYTWTPKEEAAGPISERSSVPKPRPYLKRFGAPKPAAYLQRYGPPNPKLHLQRYGPPKPVPKIAAAASGADEDWDADIALEEQAGRPSVFESIMKSSNPLAPFLKPAPNSTKSEKKAFRAEQQKKYKKMEPEEKDAKDWQHPNHRFK